MHRPYRSKDGLKVEGLTVLYAADHEGVMLIWSNDWMTYLPAKGDLDLASDSRRARLSISPGGPADFTTT